MEHLTRKFEIKSTGDSTMSGYASVFGNVDLGGDVVEPGAFREIERNSEGKVVVLFQHGATESLPIGKAEVFQDAKGLGFNAELITEDPFVRRVHTHLKAKTIERMSFGFDILPGGSEFKRDRRHLKALKLYEISVVQFGMNPLARIDGVKSKADLEKIGRDLGLTKSKARRFAFAGWPVIIGEDIDERPRTQREEVEEMYLSKGYSQERAKYLALQSWPPGSDPADANHETHLHLQAYDAAVQSMNELLRKQIT